MKKMRFETELETGHKGEAVLVPFNPATTWSLDPVSILNPTYGKSLGHPVRGTINGTSFEGWIGKRRGRTFILIDAALQKRARISVGDPAVVEVEPAAAVVAPPKSRKKSTGVSYDTVRELGLALPGVEEGSSYGTPALKIGKKLMTRLKEDGETLVLRIDFETRDLLLRAAPDVFFITDHYRGYPAILIRLPKIARADLSRLLTDSWLQQAPKKLLQEHGPRLRP